MAVAIDSNSGVTSDTSAATAANLATFTVGSGASRLLLVFLAFDRTTTTGRTVSWDSAGTPQPMTLLAGQDASDNSTRVEIWGLLTPTSGNKNLAVTWTVSAECIIEIVSFTGADQSALATTISNVTQTTASTANPSRAITSATGNYTAAAMSSAAFNASALNQTQVANVSGAGAVNEIASIAVGAATVTHTFTQSACAWGMIGLNVNGVGAIGGPVKAVITRPFPFKPGSPPSRNAPYR